MAEFVGATVVGDSVVSWAIGGVLSALAERAKHVVYCGSACKALADTIEGGEMRALAKDLDRLTQAEAYEGLLPQYNELCELLEEAHYLVRRCQQAGTWGLPTRVRIGNRVEVARRGLEAIAKEIRIQLPAALQQDRMLAEQRTHAADLDEGLAAVQEIHLPRQARGAIQDILPMLDPAQERHFVGQGELVSQLCAELDSSRYHGIVGMPGLGKTTIAAAVYDKVKGTYVEHFFLPVGQRPDILKLLRSVYHKLHKGCEMPFTREAAGRHWLAHELKDSKVLLVLDDVWKTEHLRLLDFASAFGCHQDSTTIITTRDEGVLTVAGGRLMDQTRVTRPETLSDEDATRLLCQHAFGSVPKPPELEMDVRDLVEECKGLPLALRTLGSSLRGKGKDEWRILIDRLKRIDPSLSDTGEVMRICRPSYEALSPHLRRCFIDFAAYPEDARVQVDELVTLWAARAPFMTAASVAAAKAQLQQLAQRSLVIVSEDNAGRDVVHMHDILRDIAVLEARERGNKCAYEAGVDNVPEALAVEDESSAWWQCLKRVPPYLRKRWRTASDVTRVSLHGNGNAAQCWERGLPRLRVLQLQKCSAASLPPTLGSFTGLRVLSLSGVVDLHRLPQGIGKLFVLNVLDLSWCEVLTELPDCIGQLSALQQLCVSKCAALTALPDSIGQLSALQKLDMSGCGALAALPDSIGQLWALQLLDMSECEALEELPKSIGQLSALETLDMCWCCALAALPDSIVQLSALQKMYMSWCEVLMALPDRIGQLSSLQELYVSKCEALTALPKSIGQLSRLQLLDISGCGALAALPDSLGHLLELQKLDMTECNALAKLPESIGQLSALQLLAMTECDAITALPESLGQLSKLQVLYMWGCEALTALPESIGQLSALQELDTSGCKSLAALPESIGQLSALQELDTSGCKALAALPESIGQLSALQKLDMRGCKALTALPQSISQLSNLHLLDISGCRSLGALPDSIVQLSAQQELEIRV